MPRLRRYCPPGIPVHIIQRGNNRQICFTSDSDMAAYANWLAKAAEKYGLRIHAWVFMTNHIHLLATPEYEHTVSRVMQMIGRYYVPYFNQANKRTGTLFERRFRACLVQEEQYFLACPRYIELNPVRAGMVRDPADYIWSSYRTHSFGQDMKLWSGHKSYLELGIEPLERQKNYRSLFESSLDRALIAEIRDSVNTGFGLGKDRFKDQVEQTSGQRQRRQKRGPTLKLSL
jgi:putative transposase